MRSSPTTPWTSRSLPARSTLSSARTAPARARYGIHRPDSGELRFSGEDVRIDSPAAARKLGIGMVFQDFRLVPAFTVAENVARAVPGSGPRLNLRALSASVAEAAARFGLACDPDAIVGDLSIGERQRVEILKVLKKGIGMGRR